MAEGPANGHTALIMAEAPMNGHKVEAQLNGHKVEAPLNGHKVEAPLNGHKVEAPLNGNGHKVETQLNGHKVVEGPKQESESRMWLEEVNGECMIRFFSTSDPKVDIVAITKGDLANAEAVPVRVHSECFTGDILGSQRCDCGQQLHKFLSVMNSEPRALLLYIRGHEGRGIGLHNKIRAYQLQDQGVDTVDANVQLGLPVDMRTYEDTEAVIRQLGIQNIKLYTNNPEKIFALKDITTEVVALSSSPSQWNIKYLRTKRERLNHRTVLETNKLPEPARSEPDAAA